MDFCSLLSTTWLTLVLIIFTFILNCQTQKKKKNKHHKCVCHTFCGVEVNASPPCAVQYQWRTTETIERPGCVHTCSILTGISKFTLVIIWKQICKERHIEITRWRNYDSKEAEMIKVQHYNHQYHIWTVPQRSLKVWQPLKTFTIHFGLYSTESDFLYDMWTWQTG